MAERFWTISNALSLVRLLLSIPIVLLLEQQTPGARVAAGFVCLAAVATDYLDGWLARRLNEVTSYGKILDPVADKIVVGLVAALLAAQDLIPLWFFLAVIVRDALILGGGLYLRRVRGTVLQSNVVGKWTVTVVALALLLTLFLPEEYRAVATAVLWLSALMLLLSLGIYTRRFLEVAGQAAPLA